MRRRRWWEVAARRARADATAERLEAAYAAAEMARDGPSSSGGATTQKLEVAYVAAEMATDDSATSMRGCGRLSKMRPVCRGGDGGKWQRVQHV
jgi:hypothetical protein